MVESRRCSRAQVESVSVHCGAGMVMYSPGRRTVFVGLRTIWAGIRLEFIVFLCSCWLYFMINELSIRISFVASLGIVSHMLSKLFPASMSTSRQLTTRASRLYTCVPRETFMCTHQALSVMCGRQPVKRVGMLVLWVLCFSAQDALIMLWLHHSRWSDGWDGVYRTHS